VTHHDPHAIPFPSDRVKVEASPDLIKVGLHQADIAIYMHDKLDGTPPYLVIDIDNELDADIDPLELKIYRNDAPVYIETSTTSETAQEGK